MVHATRNFGNCQMNITLNPFSVYSQSDATGRITPNDQYRGNKNMGYL